MAQHGSSAMDLKLLVLSDLHSNHTIIGAMRRESDSKEITVLIVCGDLTHFGDLSEAKETLKRLREPGFPVLFVPGNCDPKELASFESVHGAINLHGRSKDVEGLSFFGIGGSPFGPFHTPFEMSENEMKRVLSKIKCYPKGVKRFVLVSHTPPANTVVDLTMASTHAGSYTIREFVEAKKPFLVLCGHIHEAKGKDIIDGTLIVNPGPAQMGSYAVIDVDEDIKVSFEVIQ